MPQTNLGGAVATETAVEFTDYSVDAESTDAPSGSEFYYNNSNFGTQLGYYKSIPELKIAVDTKANWVLGNGYEADEMTQIVLDRIRGTGKDTFNSILENMERTCYIGEDAYAEIVTDDNGQIINLKQLDPGTIKVVYNAQGMILRYEQESKNRKPNKKFKPHEIFVLSHNRIADEVHGNSVVAAVENIILMRNEAMADWKRVLHRNIDPLFIFHMDTDDASTIATYKAKQDAARGSGENIYVPKGTIVPEIVAVSPNASLNPLAWIQQLNDYFFQAVGVPQIIVGNAKEFTDASGKIVYLAFEQRIKGRQKYVEEQCSQQLNLIINLVFPATLQNEAISSYPDEQQQGMAPEEEPIQNAAEPANTQEAPV